MSKKSEGKSGPTSDSKSGGVSTSTPIGASSRKLTDIIPDGIFSPVITAKSLFTSKLPVLKRISSVNTPTIGTGVQAAQDNNARDNLEENAKLMNANAFTLVIAENSDESDDDFFGTKKKNSKPNSSTSAKRKQNKSTPTKASANQKQGKSAPTKTSANQKQGKSAPTKAPANQKQDKSDPTKAPAKKQSKSIPTKSLANQKTLASKTSTSKSSSVKVLPNKKTVTESPATKATTVKSNKQQGKTKPLDQTDSDTDSENPFNCTYEVVTPATVRKMNFSPERNKEPQGSNDLYHAASEADNTDSDDELSDCDSVIFGGKKKACDPPLAKRSKVKRPLAKTSKTRTTKRPVSPSYLPPPNNSNINNGNVTPSKKALANDLFAHSPNSTFLSGRTLKSKKENAVNQSQSKEASDALPHKRSTFKSTGASAITGEDAVDAVPGCSSQFSYLPIQPLKMQIANSDEDSVFVTRNKTTQRPQRAAVKTTRRNQQKDKALASSKPEAVAESTSSSSTNAQESVKPAASKKSERVKRSKPVEDLQVISNSSDDSQITVLSKNNEPPKTLQSTSNSPKEPPKSAGSRIKAPSKTSKPSKASQITLSSTEEVSKKATGKLTASFKTTKRKKRSICMPTYRKTAKLAVKKSSSPLKNISKSNLPSQQDITSESNTSKSSFIFEAGVDAIAKTGAKSKVKSPVKKSDNKGSKHPQFSQKQRTKTKRSILSDLDDSDHSKPSKSQMKSKEVTKKTQALNTKKRRVVKVVSPEILGESAEDAAGRVKRKLTHQAESNQDEIGGLRRSKRMRVGRLAYWEGERFTHYLNNKGEDEYKYVCPAHNGIPKKKAQNSPSKVKASKLDHPTVAKILRCLAAAMDRDEDENSGFYVDVDTHMELALDRDHPDELSECQVICDFAGMRPMSKNEGTERQDDDFRFASVLQCPWLDMGYIRINPGTSKGRQVAPMKLLTFLMLSSDVQISVNGNIAVLDFGHTFVVPPGVVYDLTNMGSQPALVAYTSINLNESNA